MSKLILAEFPSFDAMTTAVYRLLEFARPWGTPGKPHIDNREPRNNDKPSDFVMRALNDADDATTTPITLVATSYINRLRLVVEAAAVETCALCKDPREHVWHIRDFAKTVLEEGR